MGNPSQFSAPAVRTLRAAKTPASRGTSALAPVPAQPIAAAPPAPARPAPEPPQELNIIGPRKLVRPTLTPGMRERRFSRRDDSVLPWQTSTAAAAPAMGESSHAEVFYFQKQVQTQTLMVFVLEDGERIEGCIEWYDRNAIKVRSSSARGVGRPGESGARTLIYKSSIKYLYKAGENQSTSQF